MLSNVKEVKIRGAKVLTLAVQFRTDVVKLWIRWYIPETLQFQAGSGFIGNPPSAFGILYYGTKRLRHRQAQEFGQVLKNNKVGSIIIKLIPE